MSTAANSSETTGSVSASFQIDPLQGPTNWAPWKIKVKDILAQAGCLEHISGTAGTPAAPDEKADENAKATYQTKLAEWKRKDLLALTHIRLRVADSQLVYVGGATTAKQAWDALEGAFESRGIQAEVLARREFLRAQCPPGGDIPDHIRKMRENMDRVHTAAGKEVISDDEFAITLLTSLPDEWNTFIQTFDGSDQKQLTSAGVIARILQEDTRRKARESAQGDSAMVAKSFKHRGKCHNCGKRGHFKAQCKERGGGADAKGPDGGRSSFGGKANEVVESSDDFLLVAQERFEDETDRPADQVLVVAVDESRLWYADNGATCHVATARDLFSEYEPVKGRASISGVGGDQRIVGRGSIKLRCKVGDKVHTLTMSDVAHVPDAPHNLLSLIRADDAGCKYVGQSGSLTVYGPKGNVLMVGTKPPGTRRLYRMHVAAVGADQAQVAILGKRTWEEFHRAMGHVGIAALKKMKLEGLAEAKQHVQPFPEKATRVPEKLEIGQIVASDVWGPAQRDEGGLGTWVDTGVRVLTPVDEQDWESNYVLDPED